MLLALAIVFAVLSRAEVIERFRAPQIVQVDGLVQVRAECGPDMRREFQLPVAGYAANICRRLYAAENLRERHFTQPGIAIVIGDVVTNLTNVVCRFETRQDGSKWTRILVPAPGYADRNALTVAITKGYYRAVHSRDLSDDAAVSAFRQAIPEMKLEDDYRSLQEWYDGKRGKEDDEKFLKLQRSVLKPGYASKHDVEIYASRLFLFPEYYDLPFGGRYHSLSFREAIPLAKRDPAVRTAAFRKIQEVMLFASGRGEKMKAAGVTYAAFLNELSKNEKSEAQLTALLDGAEYILKGVLE